MGRAPRCRTFHSAPLTEDLGGTLQTVVHGHDWHHVPSRLCLLGAIVTTLQHDSITVRVFDKYSRRTGVPAASYLTLPQAHWPPPKHRPSCILVCRQPGRPGHINSLGEGRETENLVYFCRLLSFSSPSLAAGDTPLSSNVRAVADATRCQMLDALEPQDGRPSRPSASVPSLSRQRRCRRHLRQPCCHRAASASRRLRAEATTSPSQCLSSAALTTAEPDTHAHTHSTNARPDRTSKPKHRTIVNAVAPSASRPMHPRDKDGTPKPHLDPR